MEIDCELETENVSNEIEITYLRSLGRSIIRLDSKKCSSHSYLMTSDIFSS